MKALYTLFYRKTWSETTFVDFNKSLSVIDVGSLGRIRKQKKPDKHCMSSKMIKVILFCMYSTKNAPELLQTTKNVTNLSDRVTLSALFFVLIVLVCWHFNYCQRKRQRCSCSSCIALYYSFNVDSFPRSIESRYRRLQLRHQKEQNWQVEEEQQKRFCPPLPPSNLIYIFTFVDLSGSKVKATTCHAGSWRHCSTESHVTAKWNCFLQPKGWRV